MESFLSRVTEKTFPWASWCHVTPTGLHLTNFSFFPFKKEYLYRRFEFWRQNSSAFSWHEFKLIITNQKKTKVVKIVIDNKKSQNYHFYFKQERYIQIHRYETKIAHLPIYLWHWNLLFESVIKNKSSKIFRYKDMMWQLSEKYFNRINATKAACNRN